MRKMQLLLLLLIGLLALAACGEEAETNSQAAAASDGVVALAPNTPTAAAEPVATADPTPEEELAPDEPAAAGQAGAGEPLTVTQSEPLTTTITIDLAELPFEARVLQSSELPYRMDPSTGPSGLPAHFRVEFVPVATSAMEAALPQLYVIPVEAYRAQWAEADDMGVDGTLTALIMTIEDGLRPFQEAGVPGIPVELVGAAFNDLAVQGEYVALENVTGLRFVGRYVAEPEAVSNDGLTYIFFGFSNDGRFLISFFYPIRTDALPDDASETTAFVAEQLQADPFSYLSEQVQMLNQLDESDFEPAVSTLDAVVASLRFGNETGTDEIVAEAMSEESAIVAEGHDLGGTSWHWLSLEQVDNRVAVAGPSSYSVTFTPGGEVVVAAGCNQASGTFTNSEDGGLDITLSEHPPSNCVLGALDQILIGGLRNAESFERGDAELMIRLQYQNGSLIFGPALR